MSSNKYKIYDIEVILRYKINNITRDYTLCSRRIKQINHMILKEY